VDFTEVDFTGVDFTAVDFMAEEVSMGVDSAARDLALG